jgi:hypothetical protein
MIAVGIGLAVAAPASADPNDGAPTDPAPAPGPVGGPITSAAAPIADAPSSAAADACKTFGAAVSYAATNYEDFAYATAGGGNNVDYTKPEVWDSNVVGRTALREAAATAMQAATTPGLQPDIAAPMQSWSMRATKLLLVMGLRAGGDTLNTTANDMNTDAHNAQMACATAGTHA